MVSTLGVFNLHPLEVVSRYRDPQLQVGENYNYSWLFYKIMFIHIEIGIEVAIQISMWMKMEIDTLTGFQRRGVIFTET